MPGGRHLPSQWAGTSRWVPGPFLSHKKAQKAQTEEPETEEMFCAFCAFLWLRKAGEGDGDVVEAAPGERQIDESLTGIFD